MKRRDHNFLLFFSFYRNWNDLMYKGNKGDRHVGLHYQCVIEVSGNINADANIKVFQIKLKKTETTTHIHMYTQVARMTFCFFKSGPQTKQLGRPCFRLLSHHLMSPLY